MDEQEIDDFRHLATRQLRDLLVTVLQDVARDLSTLFPNMPQATVAAVCQWPERECETVYLTGPAGNVVRIRVDSAESDDAEEFMRDEPGVQYTRIEVPNDASELLKGDLGL